jgi:hypothetical protein
VDDDPSQVAFMYRIFAAAEQLNAPFLIWFLARDPETGPDDGLGALANMGLYDASGHAKNAVKVWRGYLARPLQ